MTIEMEWKRTQRMKRNLAFSKIKKEWKEKSSNSIFIFPFCFAHSFITISLPYRSTQHAVDLV